MQERGRLCIGPGEEVYEGMIIGLNNRDNDLVVNPLKGKKLTNMRAAGKDENVVLTPPIRFSLEQAMEFIDDDELIEVTPDLHPAAQAQPARDTTASARSARPPTRFPEPRIGLPFAGRAGLGNRRHLTDYWANREAASRPSSGISLIIVPIEASRARD